MPDLAAVGPLDPTQLVDAVPQEGEQTAAGASGGRRRLLGDRGVELTAADGGVTLDLVRGADVLGLDVARLAPERTGLGQACLVDVCRRVVERIRRAAGLPALGSVVALAGA